MKRAVHGRRRRVALCLAVPALVLSGCGSKTLPPDRTSDARPSPAPGVVSDPLVWLQAIPGGDVPARQEGSAHATVGVTTLSDGVVTAQPSTDPGVSGYMLRFPTFTKAAVYPRAVVTVTESDPSGSPGTLDPGDSDFSWGADFDVDQVSTERVEDNGNNIVQRGISSFPALFKLEIDYNDRPTCTVRGTRGTLIVRSRQAVLPGTWARAECTRHGDSLTVAVGDVVSDGTASLIRRTVTGPVGSVVQSDPSVPMTVGGKIGSDGKIIASASDQFNGWVANPYLRIER